MNISKIFTTLVLLILYLADIVTDILVLNTYWNNGDKAFFSLQLIGIAFPCLYTVYSVCFYCSCNGERRLCKEEGVPLVLMVPRARRFLKHLFTHILLASMGALSHTVYASKEEKVNSER